MQDMAESGRDSHDFVRIGFAVDFIRVLRGDTMRVTHRFAGLLGLAALLFAAPAVANYIDIIEAFIQGDYDVAYRELRPYADEGEAEAQLFMGVMEQNGLGTSKNPQGAATWYRLAANQGHPEAQYNLALLFGSGIGVAQDHAQSAVWLRKAAEQGHAEGQYRLGLLLIAGQGVAQDYTEAAIWQHKAAEQMIEGAMHNLGVMYAQGAGVDPDIIEAYMWFDIAASLGYGEAESARRTLANTLSPDEIDEGERRSLDWLQRKGYAQ